jgi:hypothetical protein
MPKSAPLPADDEFNIDRQSRSVDLLMADPDNPRFISDEALAGLEVSVHDFGDISGIVFNRRTNQLVCGHQRLTALRRAGVTEWSAVMENGLLVYASIVHPKTGEQFQVRIVDWDPVKQRLANLTANNPHLAGQFTPAALDQLRELENEAAFEGMRLDKLQADLSRKAESKDDDDDQRDEVPRSSFIVLIECTDEAQQAELLERFAGEGLKVKALVQ